MRTFSANVQNLLDQDVVEFYFLIKIMLSTPQYYTNYPSDITFDTNTYLANGAVFETDPPKFSTVVDREGYRIVINDVNDIYKGEFESGVVGADIEVRVFFTDASGTPQLNTDDVIFVYKGYVDAPAIKTDWDTKTIVLEGSSPMADLDKINSFWTTRSSMDAVNVSDTSFDRVFDGNEVVLKWGKED